MPVIKSYAYCNQSEDSNPYAVSAWTVAALTAAVVTYHPFFQALLFLVLLNTGHAFDLKLKGILKIAVIVSLPLTLINVFFNHLGDHVVLRIPSSADFGVYHLAIPFVSGAITAESLVYAFIVAFMISNTILIFTSFQRRVSPDYLLAMMPDSLPNLSLTLAVVFRFIPLISENYRNVVEAQMVRGADFRSGSLFRRTLGYLRILKPVVVNTFERAHNLSESLAARAYNGKRTAYNQIIWAKADVFETGLYFVAFALLLSSKISGALIYWPYENLVPSPPQLIPLICILVLGVPAITHRSGFRFIHKVES